MTGVRGSTALVVTASLLAVIFSANATAQVQSALPRIASAVDGRGVNLTRGTPQIPVVEVAIGQPGAGGLIHSRSWLGSGWRDGLAGTASGNGSFYSIVIGDWAEVFTYNGGTSSYDPNYASGSTLVSSGNTLTYTMPDGTIALFDKTLADGGGVTNFWSNTAGLITSLTRPDNEVITWTYTTASAGGQTGRRPQSVSNNLGYQIHFDYEIDSPADAGQVTGGFLKRDAVRGINRAYYYCADTAFTCSDTSGLPSGMWPKVTYGTDSGMETVTDNESRVTKYVVSGTQLTGIRKPGSPSTNYITFAYHTSGIAAGWVQSATIESRTWTYGYTSSGSLITTSVTAPGSRTERVIEWESGSGRVTSDDIGGRETTYLYSTARGPYRVVGPDGNYMEFTFDGRGNITQATFVPESGSGLSNIVTSATFGFSCSTYPKICNKPSSTTDARGFKTDYDYDSTHGGLTKVTLPAPSGSTPYGSGTRPEARSGYSQLYAYYLNASSSMVAAPTAVYRLAETSSCATGSAPSCLSTADESKIVIGYGSTGVANNRLPVSTTASAGNGSISAATATTYTAIGDVASIDGALSGAGDTTYFYYDLIGRVRALVTPDPDGGGSLLHRVARISYTSDGQVSLHELGTVSTPANWGSMTVLQSETMNYTDAGRLARWSLASGGSTYLVEQYTYDQELRTDCTALRMNPSLFGSLPSSACNLGTQGSFGPDRISKAGYHPYLGDRTVEEFGVGTTLARYDATTSFSSSGNLIWALDAKNNLTSYQHDGFNRLVKMIYPSATTPGQSNSSDYEQFAYDDYSRLNGRRSRDGNWVDYCYDNLDRVIYLKASGSTRDTSCSSPTITYGYDNLGRVTSAAQSGHTVSYAYDALNRRTSETQAGRTVGYEYDAAGRRTKMTWPDSFYVNYDYNAVGEVTAIRENGATSGVGVLTTFTYDNLGKRTSLARGNSSYTNYDRDGISRMWQLYSNLSGGSYDFHTTYSFNPADQIVGTTNYNASYNPAAPSTFTDNYSSNGLNRYTSAAGITPTYTDGRGNMTYDGTKTYGYDYANRMTSAGSATLAYDPASRLYQVAGGTTTQFLYDGPDVIAEYVSGSVARRYVHGPGLDEPLVWYEGSSTSDRRHLFADERGSIVAVEGSSTSINKFDEYGVPDSGNVGRFQYTGQLWVSEIGLYHYKARAYNPEFGRFMQTDPIGYAGGMNLYAYVGGDPINNVDPSGLKKDEGCTGTRIKKSCKNVGRLYGAKDGYDFSAPGFPTIGSGGGGTCEEPYEDEEGNDVVPVCASPPVDIRWWRSDYDENPYLFDVQFRTEPQVDRNLCIAEATAAGAVIGGVGTAAGCAATTAGTCSMAAPAAYALGSFVGGAAGYVWGSLSCPSSSSPPSSSTTTRPEAMNICHIRCRDDYSKWGPPGIGGSDNPGNYRKCMRSCLREYGYDDY